MIFGTDCHTYIYACRLYTTASGTVWQVIFVGCYFVSFIVVDLAVMKISIHETVNACRVTHVPTCMEAIKVGAKNIVDWPVCIDSK